MFRRRFRCVRPRRRLDQRHVRISHGLALGGRVAAAPIYRRVRLAGVTQHVEMATKCAGLPRLTATDTEVRTGSERSHYLFGALRYPVRPRPGLAVGLCSPVHRALPVALNDREKPMWPSEWWLTADDQPCAGGRGDRRQLVMWSDTTMALPSSGRGIRASHTGQLTDNMKATAVGG